MPERFLPRVRHVMTKPFVEGGRKVRQVSNDILDGGRRKRLDETYGISVKDSALRDFSRAAGPMALFLGSVGFSIPLAIELITDIAVAPASDINWVVSLAAAGGGFLIGGIVNTEHSRRVGRDWRLFAEQYRDVFELWLNRAALRDTDSGLLKDSRLDE